MFHLSECFDVNGRGNRVSAEIPDLNHDEKRARVRDTKGRHKETRNNIRKQLNFSHAYILDGNPGRRSLLGVLCRWPVHLDLAVWIAQILLPRTTAMEVIAVMVMISPALLVVSLFFFFNAIIMANVLL